jgi:anti-sigma-K factor RskA
MTQPDLSADDRAALAGELALGVLEGEERARALRLMLADPAFAAEVDAWRTRTSGLFDAIDDVAPPPAVWDAIAARIGAKPQPVAANDRWWKVGTFASMAVAAALALALILPQQTAPVPAATDRYAVAQLTGEIDGLRIATRYDPATATLRVRASGMPSTPTEPELWVVPADGVPRSLGQIDRDGETVILVAQGHRSLINPAAIFGLTMEPRSAVPHEAPSAPIVASGAIDLI